MNPVITRIAAGGIAIVGGTVFALSQFQGDQPQRAQTFTAPPDAEAAEVASAAPSPFTAPDTAAAQPDIRPEAQPAATPSQPRPALAAEADLDLPPVPAVPADPETNLSLPRPEAPRLADMAQADFGAATEAPMASAFGLPCGLAVTAEAQPGAIVALDIQSPCQPHTRVIVEHNGLTIADQTDGLGLLTMDVPAFESPAFFTIRLAGTDPEVALVDVPDLRDFDRVAVAWVDHGALELHALEFGAGYGEGGHVSNANPRDADHAVRGEGGFLTRLGSPDLDAPMMAEIYTFPRDAMAGEGVVRLSLEAPITASSCGAEADARTLQTGPEGVSVVELSFSLPGCEAVGDALVLQNLLRDLRVAAN